MHVSPSLLIIDDHPIIRVALADALRKRFPRLRLETVGDAESGIALL
jgi:DNA-binding NarL/FixJ family response regulator